MSHHLYCFTSSSITSSDSSKSYKSHLLLQMSVKTLNFLEMDPLMYLFNFPRKKVLLLSLVLALFLFASPHLCNGSSESEASLVQSKEITGGRRMLKILDEDEEEEELLLHKKKTQSLKNQTKLAKVVNSSKNQTKLLKSPSSKNQTKLLKSTNTTATSTTTTTMAAQLKKLNSTSKLKKLNSTTTKPFNNTKIVTLTKKNLDLIKSAVKNKTTTAATKKSSPDQNESKTEKKQQPPKIKQKQPSWIEEDDEDLVSEFRDLPTRFQQTLIPDLERISTQSKAYITQANKQMAKGFKPYVGNKYAPTIASFVCFAFIVVPFLLVSLIFNRIKAFFSLQKLIIFIQIYLSIYFSILCLSSLATGLEPLKFFYATSASTYVCVQVMQTLGYVLYLLMLLMYLVLVFSTDSGLGSKFLGLAQTFVGYAVGLHYYVAVFHRVVLHQPPKTNWKVHGVYAACFLVICMLAQAERRKKAYGEEGKKS